jgi:hypothetical protein
MIRIVITMISMRAKAAMADLVLCQAAIPVSNKNFLHRRLDHGDPSAGHKDSVKSLGCSSKASIGLEELAEPSALSCQRNQVLE